MAKTTVVNMRYCSEFDVRIDRGSMWGNKYHIGPDGTREEVIKKYERDFCQRLRRRGFYKATLALKGKVLACWCKPLPCHGDVIVEWLEG